MPTSKHRPQPAQRADSEAPLRQRAEEALSIGGAEDLEACSPDEIRRLVHELRVHQIELELQNEELRRTQEELEISRTRYFELYELAPVGYLTLSAHGLIKDANLTAATILNVPRSTLRAQPLARFIAPEDRPRYYQHQRWLVEAGTPHVCELRIVRADNVPLSVRLEASVARDKASGEAEYHTVISDITARVQAEVALRELNATLTQRVDVQTTDLREREERLSAINVELTRALRLKDEFLSMMSHELRTPMNIVLGVTEAMAEELYGPILARQRQALASVGQSGRHLLALLSDILDLARISAGRESLDLQPVNVDLLCKAALLYVQPSAEARGVQLIHTIEYAIVGLRADERRLTQILINLLSNAVKFTPAGGKVGLEVSTDAAHGHIQFSVWDTGIGIAAVDQAQLFEPFTQVDGGLGRQYEGMGLGLTLVRRLVELHGGSVSLESAPGQGSRFTVRLPWSPQDNAAPLADDTQEAALARWATPPQVVIADDHELTLQFYADLLRQLGCQVALARTGVEAVDQVRVNHPDVAVLDIQMPDLDGLAAIRRIREDPGLSGVPIIALTALAMPGDRERCLAAGATVYLAKPVSPRTLVATITEVLERPGAAEL